MFATRPIVTVQPSFAFTRCRSRVSAQVKGMAGWKRLSGSSGRPSARPEMPT
jgi:hypothetical protein